jgi:hypothetical protein
MAYINLTLPSAMSRIAGPAKNALLPADEYRVYGGCLCRPKKASSSRRTAHAYLRWQFHRSGLRKDIETLEKRIHNLEALLRHDSTLRRSVSYEEDSDSSQHRIESGAPVSETVDGTRHHARDSVSED